MNLFKVISALDSKLFHSKENLNNKDNIKNLKFLYGVECELSYHKYYPVYEFNYVIINPKTIIVER